MIDWVLARTKLLLVSMKMRFCNGWESEYDRLKILQWKLRNSSYIYCIQYLTVNCSILIAVMTSLKNSQRITKVWNLRELRLKLISL